MNSTQIQELNTKFDKQSAQEILKWAFDQYGESLVLASSFGCEDVALIDMAHQMKKKWRIITLDTGRLPEETFRVIDAIQLKYGVQIETFFPDASKIEQLTAKKGFYSFKESIENRKECCRLRKKEPLDRALQGSKAWVTGQRRSQGVTRSDLAAIDTDSLRKDVVKINPLVNWNRDQVWEYIKVNNVPYNKLFDEGYLSIGCAPCTRAVKDGEDERAGRWWWEDPNHKECGIHR